MEIKEKSETANTYDLVPRQKGIFKLRSNVEKKVVVSVQQISQNSCNLAVERCFGMLVSPGRNVRHADMQLLEHVTMATTSSPNADVDVHANVITGKKNIFLWLWLIGFSALKYFTVDKGHFLHTSPIQYLVFLCILTLMSRIQNLGPFLRASEVLGVLRSRKEKMTTTQSFFGQKLN